MVYDGRYIADLLKLSDECDSDAVLTHEHVAAVCRYIAELERDKARMDFIMRGGWEVWRSADEKWRADDGSFKPEHFTGYCTYREAIDAAMESEGGAGETIG